MKNYQIPYFTVLLSTITLLFSFYVAYDITGSFFARVRVTDLEEYGVRFEYLLDGQLWRLFTSQIIHVKQFHMLFNVVSLFVLGLYIERYVGLLKMSLLWFVSGSAGTVVSTFFGKEPWNLGTGASQAIMGVAALAALIIYTHIDVSKGLKYAVAFALIPALLLDLIYAGYPKPGHLLGFLVGLGIGLIYIRGNNIRLTPCPVRVNS